MTPGSPCMRRVPSTGRPHRRTPRPQRRRSASSRWVGALRPYLYILPTFVFLIAFTYVPVVRSVWMSLHESHLAVARPVFVGLDNYRYAFSEPLFWKVLRNNLVYALATIPTSVGLGLFFAVLLNRPVAASGLYRSSLFYPTVLPMAAASMLWLWMFTPGYGLVNHYLGKLGFPDIEWTGDPRYAMWALVIVGIWKYTGYYMVLLLAGLQTLPTELYEAAAIEGASPWQQFWRITFPLLSPTTFFVTVMAIINSFQSIDQVYLMTRGGPANATNMLVYYIYQVAFRFWDMGYASALSTVLFVVLLALTVLAFRVMHHRVHYA